MLFAITFKLELLSLSNSTKVTSLAPLEQASKPKAPEPANKSKTFALPKESFIQEKIVSLTLEGVGLKPSTSSTGNSFPLNLPPRIRTSFS